MQKEHYLKIRELIQNKTVATEQDIPDKELRNEINHIIEKDIKINDDVLKNIINDAFTANVAFKKQYTESTDVNDLMERTNQIYKKHKRQIAAVFNTAIIELWKSIVFSELNMLLCKKDEEMEMIRC